MVKATGFFTIELLDTIGNSIARNTNLRIQSSDITPNTITASIAMSVSTV